jgi:ParB-like chromosome segregation protein Spo0J
MTIETIPISQLSPDPANARKHGERNLQAIKGSLRRFGQQKPIIVDSRGIVRAGNGTLAAAIALGWKEIKIVRSELPDIELTAYAVADNRTAELAEWDQEILGKLLSDVQIGDVGFDESEMNRTLADDSSGAKDAEDQREIAEAYEVIVECDDEEQQQEVFQRLQSEGLKCRLFTL